jgi:hypothetical protein
MFWHKNNLPTSEEDNNVYFLLTVRIHGLVFSDLELIFEFSILRS